MNIKFLASAGALAAALLSPGLASASFVLDTGTPTGSAYDVFGSTTWYAEEFYLSAGQTLTSLSADLTQGTGAPGTTFTFDVYSNTGPGGTFLNNTAANRNANQVLSATGTFSATGWNTATVNWTAATSGDYWLAIQQTATGASNTLEAQTEASASTGTAPALGYAIYSTSAGSKFQSSTGNPIGMEVNAVPLPAAGWLLACGLGGLGSMARRRRNAA